MEELAVTSPLDGKISLEEGTIRILEEMTFPNGTVLLEGDIIGLEDAYFMPVEGGWRCHFAYVESDRGYGRNDYSCCVANSTQKLNGVALNPREWRELDADKRREIFLSGDYQQMSYELDADTRDNLLMCALGHIVTIEEPYYPLTYRNIGKEHFDE